ncbi:MAG: antibiotic biosynthesis monooxygenase [Pleurocapsa sp. SU_196_0]|nr:antibiotic biosynthesis monooxygenase [Pleurocapsa sp. SU_196_0]
MIAVIFEVQPHPEHVQTYLEIASSLRADLETMPGFISVERFQSLTTPGKMLSLSFWENEAAVKHWREHTRHHEAQLRGRLEVFADYRLRVAAVIRDYGLFERAEAPQVMPSLER